MTLEPWLHFLHILGAILWVGGGVMLSIFGTRARRSDDSRILAEFAKTLSYAGLRALAPAVFVVLVTGIWLVLVSAEWDFRQLWVLLALGAFIVAFLIGAVYLSRVAIELERMLTRSDLNLQAARDVLGRWIVGYQVVLLILLFAVWDMVFKPGA
jgi:uncharacterized membrane protein